MREYTKVEKVRENVPKFTKSKKSSLCQNYLLQGRRADMTPSYYKTSDKLCSNDNKISYRSELQVFDISHFNVRRELVFVEPKLLPKNSILAITTDVYHGDGHLILVNIYTISTQTNCDGHRERLLSIRCKITISFTELSFELTSFGGARRTAASSSDPVVMSTSHSTFMSASSRSIASEMS